MGKEGKTFSESWYRIADLRVSLRPTVEVRLQFFRGEKWYVLHDKLNNQFMRMRPDAYTFVGRLKSDRRVEEVWRETLEHAPDHAPGQDDVLRLLSQLHRSNLLYFSGTADHDLIFERYRKRKGKELQAKLLGIMFMRLPIWDPDRLLDRFFWLARSVYSVPGFLVWLSLMLWSTKVFVDHFEMAREQLQGILAPGNLLFLWLFSSGNSRGPVTRL